MKKTKIMVAFASMALAGTMASVQAQLPVSRTAGVELTNLTTGFQFVAMPFSNEPIARGIVTNISTNDLTLDVAAGSFTGLSGEHVAQVVSGPDTGLTFDIDETNSTGTTVRLIGFSGSGADVDDDLTQIQVIKLQTLDDAFPNGGNFTDSTGPGGADQLLLVDGSGGLFQAYYNTSLGWSVAGTDADASATVLPLNGGIFVLGTASTTGSVLTSGVAPSNDQKVSFSAGSFTSVGNPYGTITLGDLTSSVTASTAPGGADTILYDTGSGLAQAYRNTDGNWKVAGTDAILPDSTSVGEGFYVFGKADGEFTFAEVITE